MSYKHIGIVRLSAIGDTVMVVPMVRALQQTYPNTKISWIIGRQAFSLLEGLSGVDFIVINKPKTIKDYYQFRYNIKKYNFDVLLAMQASFRANLLYPLINAKRKIGFDKSTAKDFHGYFVKEHLSVTNKHLLDGFMTFASYLGAKLIADPQWELALYDSDYSWANQYQSRPYIVINPAASKQERTWPTKKYIQLIKAIQARGAALDIILTGAESDLSLANIIQEKTGVTSLVGKTNLKQLAALLEKACCLIAPDTGPVHIATAVQTPVIGLYAVISSKLSGPYCSQHLVIDKYNHAVERILGCSEDSVSWGRRVHDAAAMDLITVQEVLNQLKKVINLDKT